VLIVNPYIYDSAAYDFWLKPLGLLYVASILQKRDIEVEMIDLLDRYDESIDNNKEKDYSTGKFCTEVVDKPDILKFIPRDFKRYGMPVDIFREKLKNIREIDAIFIGVTLTYWYYGGLKTVEIIREFFPEIPIFLGGIYTNIYKNHAVDVFSKFNVKVISKIGIEAVNEFLDFFSMNKIDNYNWFEMNDPAYNLYKSNLKYAVITTSLGCPYKCSYCVTPKMWRYQVRSNYMVIKNIENILNIHNNIKDIVFFDDAFLLNKDLDDLLISLKSFNINFHLPNGIHAKIVNSRNSKLLKNAGFRVIKLGYETYDEENQKITGNKVNNADLINAVECFKGAGMDLKDIGAYVLLNLPGQKIDEMYKAIDFCFKLGINPNINEFTFIPGTDEYKKLLFNEKYKLFLDPLLLNNTYIPYWYDEGLSIDEIKKFKNYLSAYKRKNAGG